MLVNWNLSRNHVHGQVVDLALLLCTKHDSEHTLRPSRFVPIPSYYDQRRLNHSMSAALVSKTKSIYISFAHKNQLLFEGCHYDFQTDSILRELQPRYKSKLVTAQSNCRWPCLCPCWSKPSTCCARTLLLCKNAGSRAPPFWTETLRLSSVTAFGKWFPDDVEALAQIWTHILRSAAWPTS